MADANKQSQSSANKATNAAQKRGKFKFLFWRKNKPKETDPFVLDPSRPVTTGDLLDGAITAQTQTLEAIENMERHMAEGEEMVTESGERLNQNQDQLRRVDAAVEGAKELPADAERITDGFVRTMFRDKCFLCLFTLVVILGIVALALSFAIDTDAEPLEPNSTVEPTPAPNITNATRSMTLEVNGTNATAAMWTYLLD